MNEGGIERLKPFFYLMDRRVRVTGHEYVFDGVVISVFLKRNKVSVRVIVENDDGVCLIQNPKNCMVLLQGKKPKPKEPKVSDPHENARQARLKASE